MSFFKQIVALIIIIFILGGLITRSKRPRTPIWAIMSAAATISVLTDLEPFDNIGNVIDIDVILFLIGMFTLVGLAEESGLLNMIAYMLISRARSVRGVFISVSIVLGLLAAFAVNDTIALMGPPIVYTIARAISIDPTPLFLILAFSITIGSVMTPIGNPQNLLIAIESGISAPFIHFIEILTIPTIINLMVTPIIVMKMYNIDNRNINIVIIHHEHLRNRRDATIAGIFLAIAIIALIVNDFLHLLGLGGIEHRGFIPFVIAAIAYILSSNPRETLSRVDWSTIVFFITMFITMDGIWRSGLLQMLLPYFIPSKNGNIFLEYISITITSLLFSQVLSNVPFTKLFINYMKSIGYSSQDLYAWLTLAMSSTIAGNLTLLGAASNIIIVEGLEKRYDNSITFREFFKLGAIITAINTAIYTPFLLLPWKR